MQTKIVIRDFENTETLNSHLQSSIEDTLSPFLQQFPKCEIQVRAQEDRHRSITRKPHFECTVLVKLNHTTPVIQVHRSGDHFYTCVHDVCNTLKEVIGRKHRKLASLQARRKMKLDDVPLKDFSELQESAG